MSAPAPATTAPFDPEAVRAFRFTGLAVDLAGGTARFSYALDDRAFTETVTFIDLPPLSGPRAAAVTRLLELAYLIAGTSYYKAAAPGELRDETGLVAAYGADALRDIYLHGLGEYAYVNRLDLAPRLRFTAAGPPAERAPVTGLDLAHRALVPVGGGKDSAVSIEAARRAGTDPLLFTVGRHRAVDDTVAVAGLPLARVVRALDPELFALNATGARNGHVPVTAVVMLLGAVCAVAHGCDAVALSNERSASEGNLVWAGREVNHQWSKGLAFERLLQQLLAAHVTPELDVFSLLRPLSELSIAQRFARLTAYHPVVTSCNAAFRIEEGRRVHRWCGHCPKCHFVFLALAPFLGRAGVVEVFEGLDLYADPAQLDGYLALTGVAGDKPFECVGEVVESRVAVRLAAETGDWDDAPAFGTLAERVRAAGWPSDAQVAEALTPTAGPGRHAVPERQADLLAAALDLP